MVEHKMQFRQSAKLQSFDQLAPDESRGMLQRLYGVRLFFVRAAYVDKYARVLHVRLYAHFADHHHAFKPRVFQLARKHGVDFMGDLLSHSLVAVIGWTHLRPRYTS